MPNPSTAMPRVSLRRIVVVGGGIAGAEAALTLAIGLPASQVTLVSRWPSIRLLPDLVYVPFDISSRRIDVPVEDLLPHGVHSVVAEVERDGVELIERPLAEDGDTAHGPVGADGRARHELEAADRRGGGDREQRDVGVTLGDRARHLGGRREDEPMLAAHRDGAVGERLPERPRVEVVHAVDAEGLGAVGVGHHGDDSLVESTATSAAASVTGRRRLALGRCPG